MDKDDKIVEAISRANLLTRVRTWLPKLFNPLFRNQGGVNRAILDAIEALRESHSKQSEDIQKQLAEAKNRFEDLNLHACKTAILLERHKKRTAAELATLTANAFEAFATRDAILAKFNAIEQSAKEQQELASVARARRDSEQAENISRFEITAANIAALESLLQATSEKLEHDFSAGINQLQEETRLLQQRSESLKVGLEKTNAQNDSELTSLKKVIEQVSSKNAFARRPSALKVSDQRGASFEGTIDPSSFDAFYKAFEDQFRGTRESVFEKQLRHLNKVKDLSSKEEDSDLNSLPVIDLGCGRGEWLELLAKENIPAIGVDLNQDFISECRSRALNAEESDVFTYLSKRESNSCRAITAFHIVEHLSFPELWTFYQETLRVLAPGGIAIFETPNPNNLRVAANFFLTDITHVRPLPTSLAAFLAEYLGASKTEIHQYHPFPEAEKYRDLPMEVNDAIYGAQDYSVIFWK